MLFIYIFYVEKSTKDFVRFRINRKKMIVNFFKIVGISSTSIVEGIGDQFINVRENPTS